MGRITLDYQIISRLLTLGLGQQNLSRKFQLSLLIDVKQLYTNHFTDGEDSVHCFVSAPVNFGYMQQAVFTGHNFNECAKWHNGFHLTFIDFSNFRLGSNRFNAANRIVDSSFVISKYLNDTHVFDFFYRDRGTGLSLHFLNDLSTWSNHRTNELFIDLEANNTRSMWLVIFSWCTQSFIHLIQNMQACFFSLLQCFCQNLPAQAVDF